MPSIALGIAGGQGARDFKLAVRVQQRPLQSAVDLQERLRDLSRGEVDIRYIGRASKQQSAWQTSRQRPLLLGASVGHVAITAGTIGAFPTRRKTGRRAVLSNNHVLANENRAKIGDPVLQPGVLDNGAKGSDVVGSLADFIPLKSDAPNRMDAAVADLADGVGFDGLTLTGAALVKLQGVRAAPLMVGADVFKLGRTSALTFGKVSAIEVDDVVVDYEIGSLSFDRQVEIEGVGDEAFSLGGDSGSLVLDAAAHAAALLFAGTDQGGVNGRGLTYATELPAVLAALDLSLDI